MSSDDVTRLAAQIRSYLKAHPHAADTLSGIRASWLADKSARLESLEAALALLEREGKLRRTVQPGGESIFSRGLPC